MPSSTIITTAHPPQQVQRHVGLLDRAALHLGVALIAWGRSGVAPMGRDRRIRRWEQQVARVAREQAAERRLLHERPPR